MKIPFLKIMAGLSVIAYCAIGVAGMAGLLSLADFAASSFQVDLRGYEDTNEDLALPSITPTLIRPPPLTVGKPIEFVHGRQLRALARPCDRCGVIESVSRRERRIGTVGPGDGNMNALFGLAYATPGTDQFHEKVIKYVVTVRMDDGSYRTVQESTKPMVRPGSRVRLEEGTLAPIQ